MKILFLASGNGGTMKFIHQASKILDLDFSICGVISDRKCGSSIYSHENGFPTYVFDSWRNQEEEIIATIRHLNPDVVVTNIFKILSSDIFSCCHAQFINLHYSLLPSYGGVIGFKTLELARESNSRIIGATCHYVNEQLDGGRIIAQAAIPVDWNEELSLIGNRIFRIACETILNALLLLNRMHIGVSSNSGVIYSPDLRYDNKKFGEDFWNLIRSL